MATISPPIPMSRADYENALNPLRASVRENEIIRRYDLGPEWVGLEDRLTPTIAALAAIILLRRENGQSVSQEALLNIPEYGLLIALVQSELDNYAGFVESVMELDAEMFSNFGIEMAEAALELQGIDMPDISISPPEIDDEWRSALAAAIAVGISATVLKIGDIKSIFDSPDGFVQDIVGALELGLDRFLGVLRDYQTQAIRDAMEAVYGELDFTGFQRFSAFAPTTCMACIMLDGTVYLTIGQFSDHHNGLCILIPITDMDNLPLEIFGEELFLTFSTNEQRALMGPRYYKAWRNGEFQLRDLVAHTDDGRPVPQRLHRLTNP